MAPPVGLDCARVGNEHLGDLFQKGLHICYGNKSIKRYTIP